MTVTQKDAVAKDHGPDQDSFGWRQRLALVLTALFVSTSLCLFGTFEIISSNQGELDVTFGDVLPWLTAFSLALAAVITLAGFLLPRGIRRGLIAVLLVLGALLWIQGGFLRWNYGVFDGTAIDWASFPWQGWVDASIWLVVLAAAVRFRDRLCRHALFLSLAFIAIQSGVLITRATSISNDIGDPRAVQSTKGKFKSVPPMICQLSSSRNIFHIIMDSFQSDIFMELVREEGLAELLDGFIVYPENISTGGRTILSVPALFATNIYDGTETESEYFNKAMNGSFLHLLNKNGYVVNLLPHVAMKGISYTNYFPIGATYAERRSTHMMRTSSFLIDVSMFRQLPHFLKRVIYNNQNWRLSSLVTDPPNHVSFHQKAFFRDYTGKLETAYSKSAYHFLHLMPPHPPLVTLADGSYAGTALPHTRENYKNEARYILRLFMGFIEKLKNLEIYESSIILLQGDHGAGWARENDDSKAGKRAGRVSALLLFKPPGLGGPLKSSAAQTSLADIPATLMGLLGIKHPYSGESIMDLDPSETRNRRVVFVTDRSTKEPTVHRWVVRGSVFDSTSWHRLKTRKVEQRIHPYSWGTIVSFGIANDGDKYLTSGWSTTASTYTWNNGKSAEITFRIEEPARDVLVQLEFYPYIVPGTVDRQRIRISVNGQPPGEIDCVSQRGRWISNTIPRALLKNGRMVLSFQFPDAVAPRDIGEGHESRVFAMKLLRFQANLDTTDRSPDTQP